MCPRIRSRRRQPLQKSLSNEIQIDFSQGEQLQVLFGTPEFVAPEVIGFENVSYSADMWSLGVICYVL